MKSVTDQSGISMLELALVLSIFLPILFSIIVVTDYLYTTSALNQIVDKFAADHGVAPFTLATGDQSYFLYPRDEEFEGKKVSGAAALDRQIEELKNQVAEVLNCSNCEEFFRVEIRWMHIRVGTSEGNPLNIICKLPGDEYRANASGDSIVRHCDTLGYVDDVDGKRGRYFRSAGGKKGINFNKHALLDKMMKYYIFHQDDRPFPHAIPSAFYGVTQAQRHGFTEVREGNSQINYLRATVLFGVQVQVNLEEFLLPMSSVLKDVLSSDPNKPGIIFESSVFLSPRQVL